jgi:uncharacterized protein YndB with AHSA1/START domain
VTYFMTSPEGERHRGWWRITAVDPPASLEFEDGFADADGTPSDAMPTTSIRVTLAERDGGTRMQLTSRFGSPEQMEQLLAMGMDDGLRQAVGQMDGLLAAV